MAAILLLAYSLPLLGSAWLPASAGPLDRIDVFPGSGTLADALARAHPGDLLALHTGTFSGAVTVSTPDLVIEPAGDGPVTIDGACSTIAAVTISADGLTILGPMTVTGGHIYELNYFGQRSGTVDGLTLMPGPCHGSVGIFLQRVGALTVSATSMNGFQGGGVELLGITDTGGRRLVLDSNEVSGSGYGVHLQDVAPGTVELVGNRVDGTIFAGIKLVNSDGVLIQRNIASNDGTDGIALDATSDGNRVVGNMARGNEFDLSNAGQNNCFKRNRYQTSEGAIGC